MIRRYPPVIALMGKSGAGKTTAASHLAIDHNYRRVRFAGIFKDMLRALGLSQGELEGSLRDTPCSLLMNRTPRHAMQTLGTEWGRDLIHADLWVHAWKVRVAEQRSHGRRVVCDDCRYENEVKSLRTFHGAELWQVVRPGLANMAHSSEKGLTHVEPDAIIDNLSTIEALEKLIDEILAEG